VFDLLHPCGGEERCPTLVPHGRCPEHARALDLRRGTAAQRGYGPAWERLKAMFRGALIRAGSPLVCGARLQGAPVTTHSACQAAGVLNASDLHVDHIKPHRGDRVLLMDLLNLQYLCAHCHSVKTATEDGGFGR
jgi:5-methylcytosine-specific restriction protein A